MEEEIKIEVELTEKELEAAKLAEETESVEELEVEVTDEEEIVESE